jgi:hypothetical protein
MTVEPRLVFDIAKDGIAHATHFLFHRFDHGKKGLSKYPNFKNSEEGHVEVEY